MKRQVFDLSYFGVVFFMMMVFKTLELNTLELKEHNSTEHVIGWKSKGLFTSKLFPIDGAFLPNIKYFEYKTEIQFSNTLLIV